MYPDYRVPQGLRPAAVASPAPNYGTAPPIWWADIVQHWDLVVVDLGERYGIDLYDPAVLARPWPGVRTMILGLLGEPASRLARALQKEVAGR